MNGYIIAAIAVTLFGGGFYLGGLRGEVKQAQCQTSLAVNQSAVATTSTAALLTERTEDAAQAATDNKAEANHDQYLTKIDTSVPRTDPVIVRSGPAAVCPSAVPNPKAKAGALPANSQGGGGQSGDRDGDNRRSEIEALKKNLEIVMADYRRLDAEWPK